VRRQGGRRQQARRADPQPGQRREPPGGSIELAELRQRHQLGAALVLDDLLDIEPAPQRGGQDAARAGTDDQVRRTERVGQPTLQGHEGTGHPRRAEDATGAQHETDAGAAFRHDP
jgi:hypothetical protein